MISPEYLLCTMKLVFIVSIFALNLSIFTKIVKRPSIHSILNISLASLFLIFAMFGPFIGFFYFEIIWHFIGTQTDNLYTERKFDCARLMEFRNAVAESLKILGANLVFRYVFIFLAELGLVVKGKLNSKLLTILYIMLSALSFHGSLSMILLSTLFNVFSNYILFYK